MVVERAKFKGLMSVATRAGCGVARSGWYNIGAGIDGEAHD